MLTFTYARKDISHELQYLKLHLEALWDSPGRPVVKYLPANSGDTGSIPAPGRSHMFWGN